MDNNDILRSLRYTFDLEDDQMLAIFALVEKPTTRAEISNWLKKEEDVDFVPIYDKDLALFLNGFIVSRRGIKEGDAPIAEKSLSNNLVLLKLKIALNLKTEDIVAIISLKNLKIGKHEISAFFRKPGQDKYRECKDQILRNFILGLQLKYRP